MTIKVLFESYTEDEYNKVLNYYNSNKSENDQPLEKLDRCEGGFMIKKENSSLFSSKNDENDSIKQLRWSTKYLVPYKNYSSFSEAEEELLYKSLFAVFREKVIFIKNR
jgi:hypothetical protein